MNLKSVDTCVYFGSQNDVYPLLQMPSIKNWIYVESLPATEGDSEEIELEFEGAPSDFFTNPQSRFDFILNDWTQTFAKASYHLEAHDTEHNLLVYKAFRGKTLYFFYNTIFPETQNPLLYELLAQTNAIYFSGFIPDQVILKYVEYPLLFLISSNVAIGCENGSQDVFQFLYNNYVKDISYIYIDSVKSYEFEDWKQVQKDVRGTHFIPVSNLLEAHYAGLESPYTRDYIRQNYLEGEYTIYNNESVLKMYNREDKAYKTGKDIQF